MPEASARRGTPPARILLVDDHPITRAGLRGMLAGERGLEIVGEATNGQEALRLCHRLRPDLVLTDVRMPEMDGLALTRLLKQELPTTCVVVITLHDDPDYLLEALKAGAAGYLLKDAGQAEVLSAVRRVLGGEWLLDPALATRLLQRIAAEKPRPTELPPDAHLTPREREVLQLVTEGKTNRQIADELIVSPGTAKVHVERIIRKLGVSDRTQAAVRAVGLGLASRGSDADRRA